MTWQYGDPIPDDEEVSRYCQPSHFDRQRDEPKALAFTRRVSEDDASANRLQYYMLRTAKSRDEAVEFIRCEVRPHISLRRNGRFLVMNVGAIKKAAAKKGYPLDVLYTPDHDQGKPSHSSIFGVPARVDDEMAAAVAILRAIRCMITPGDIYPGCA